jgi:anti-sigma28 factor (negative regulator of flagellin synthesis)
MVKFMKKIVKSFLLMLLVFNLVSCSESSSQSATNNTEKSTEEAKVEEVKGFTDGTYMVGTDIPSGLYQVTITDTISNMGYVERSKDVNMEVDSIIANIILTGNGYVEVKDTDKAIKIQGAELKPIKLEELVKNIKTEVSDGIYLVGYDLEPGTYKVEVTDTTSNMGYVERSKSLAMGVDDIIANEVIQGPSYVKIEKGDFAIRLQGVKITKK